MSFKSEKKSRFRKQYDVNVTVQITENDQCAHEYPNKLLLKEIEESTLLTERNWIVKTYV